LVLNIPLVTIWVKILAIPYHVLYPAIIIFICLGVFSANNSVFDIYMVVLFGFIGYLMLVLRFDPAPLLLGFILGPMMEENLRRALLLSRGDMMVFLQKPISATLLAVTTGLLLWSAFAALRKSRITSADRSMKTP
jgi:putative tricarboxylic transport membrane protein